jgi:hypothetical protein
MRQCWSKQGNGQENARVLGCLDALSFKGWQGHWFFAVHLLPFLTGHYDDWGIIDFNHRNP